MNLFGLEIKVAKKENGNGNNGFVKKADLDNHCDKRLQTINESAKERYGNLEKRIDTLQAHINTRFDDLKVLINRK